MCNPMAVVWGATIVGGALQAKGQMDQGAVAAQVARNNQIMAEYAAQDAIKRGEEEAVDVRRKADQIKGAQRSRMAAAGLDLTTGTPAELQDQTDFFGQQDVATTRNNARRAAWSARASGRQEAALGRFSERNSQLGAFSTLLGTAGSVAGKWNQYKGG